MYCECGCLRYARKVFDETPERDVVSGTNMISGYSNLGRVQELRVLFERMGLDGVEGNEFTWNALIAGYARVGDCDDAFSVELFREMLVAGVKPNPVTITGLLPALGSIRKVNSGKEVHGLIYRTNIYNNNVFVVSALLDMYSSCGHDGMVNKGFTFFKSMRESQRVKIREEHYGCVIDMLCRSGKIEEAYDLVHELDTEVTDSMVGSFLYGCVSYNRPDLAKKVDAVLMRMKTNKPGGFVTLSNIYAAKGEWAKVEILREVMKVQGVQKLSGFSSLPNDL
ncbi:pentatricopeptide repeat-containing protein [Tanacetum coccineum]